jgi:cation transport regulator
MPYDKLSELPGAVKDNLPKHAQQIYPAVFHSAWGEYDSAAKRHSNACATH